MFDLFGKVEGLLMGFGYSALFAIVFAESGLFFGFFLPGDSLLFTAGLMAAAGIFDIYVVLAGVMVSAILGDQVGYWTGKKFGRGLFNKPDSIFFNPSHVEEAEKFYAKHGKKTIVLARFIPAVRTFAPIVAGIARMDYRTFVTYNILGGVLWTLVFVGAGYFLGRAFPDAKEFLGFVVIAIVVLTTFPVARELWKRFSKAKKKGQN